MLPDIHERIVPPQHPNVAPCSIAFVGEAPSHVEVEKGRPFVGPAGGVFNSILRTSGIDRDACFVGNVFLRKLHENNPVIHRRTVGDAAYEAQWQEGREMLAVEFACWKPTVICALGNTALLALTGKSGVSNYRAALQPGIGPFEGRWVFPTFHPSFILQKWNNYPVVVGDMARLLRAVERGGKPFYPHRELYINPTLDEVRDFLRGPCAHSDLLSCDIETGWGMIRGISFAPDETRAMYIPFFRTGGKGSRNYWPDLWTEVQVWREVKAVLEGPTPKLGQNFGAYDTPWLLRKMGIRPMNVCEDLRLLHAALYPELPKSLAWMGQAYSEQGTWKVWARHGGLNQEEQGDKRDA